MFKNKVLATAITVLFCHAAPSMAASEGAFNPALSLILSGTYGQLQRDPTLAATGFATSANPGHAQGFNIGESELGIAANIDPDFRGVATMALGAAGTFSVENAFVQSIALGDGMNFKFGRIFSALGYLNEQHAHAWDFVDQPLVYASFWNNQLSEDGLQFKWLAPTAQFVEIGAELGKARGIAGTDLAQNGAGAGTLFAHLGDDIGVEHSWRAGLSLQQTKLVSAASTGVPDLLNSAGGVSDRFSGNMLTSGADFVWKYSPNGNISERYLKVQAEYFHREQNGLLTYDTANAKLTDQYVLRQNGAYLQTVLQFMPRWRTGLRYDWMDSGTAQLGAALVNNVIANYGFNPTRITWMLDFSPSDSRFRLQLAHDNSVQGVQDNQFFMQYIMSLGAHGAHQY